MSTTVAEEKTTSKSELSKKEEDTDDNNGTETTADGAEKQRQQKQRSLDDLYAAAREEFDLDLSPAESALKTLREGREIQKLSVIRNLAELIETEPTVTMQKVLPALQEILLTAEPISLDIHCEAAVVYKNCIRDTKLLRICPELTDKLLTALLENIEAQKENVSAAAWLESLVDIADCVPPQSVIAMIVPLAIAQADSSKRVQRRLISTRLIEKLAVLVSKDILQRELSPCVQMLCQDPSPAVRTSIAQRLSVLAQALNSSSDCSALLLPCIIELCKDEDPAVREAILGTLADCLPSFSKDAKKSVLLPLLRKCTEQALVLRDASLPVVSKHFGSWLQCLRDSLVQSELKWWLDTYIRILDVSSSHQNGPTNEQIQSKSSGVPKPIPPQICNSCRRMCAYNFPCIVSVFGDDQEVFSKKLMPILEKFSQDPDDDVRSTIASGFHEIVEHRKKWANKAKIGVESTEKEQHQLLLGPFVELLSSGTSEVVQQITGNLQKILPILYVECGSTKKKNTVLAKLNNILLSCNSLLRGSGSWRAHEAYLNSISVLRHLIWPWEIKVSFVPLLKQEVLTARALPCRIAAAQSLLLMMRQLSMAKDRQQIIEFFTQEVAQHTSCYRRRLLIDVVPLVLQHFSREFFIDKFLPAVLKLSADPISNIRLQLCRTLAHIKKYFAFPNDNQSLSKLDQVVRELLISEKNTFSRQLIQQFACELSRSETDQKECRNNRAKLLEEKRLWTEKEEQEFVDEELQAVQKRRPGTSGQDGPGSPESGIFEDDWSPRAQGLTRSATTASVPQLEQQFSSSHSTAKLVQSSSFDTVAAMTNDSPSSIAKRRPPPPVPPRPSWRTSRAGVASAPPKMAIVRPQPQVTVTQRSCSPMPPSSAERSATNVLSKEAVEKITAADGERIVRKSKLPLSTASARYRSASSTPPAGKNQPNEPKYKGNEGTESVTDSLKLKKYKPANSLTVTPIGRRASLNDSAFNHDSCTQRGSSPSPMTRSASALPMNPATGTYPLQTSASSSSLASRNGSTAGRRPYGLMRVQSSSSAVEKKPAQIRCQVISMS